MVTPFMIADVVFMKNPGRAFTYRIPRHLSEHIQVGSQVLVPFGKTTAEGLVVSIGQSTPSPNIPQDRIPFALKEILALAPGTSENRVDPNLLKLAQHISEYYLAPFGHCLRLVLMSPHHSSSLTRRLTLTEKGRSYHTITRLDPDLKETLSRLARAPKGLTVTTLKAQIPQFSQVLQKLKRRGLVHEEQVRKSVRRQASGERQKEILGNNPLSLTSHGKPWLKTEESPLWLNDLNVALEEKHSREILAYSHASQVMPHLFQAIHHTLLHQRTVLIVTPAIAEAEAIVEQANHDWPNAAVCLHHDVSATTYHEMVSGIRHGTFRIVAGPRSTIFAPLPDLGLIGILQEENPLLKEEQFPYYHPREVARMRSHIESAILLLATAHPTVETYHHFSSSLQHANSIPKTDHRHAPSIQCVDLQQRPWGTWLSPDMINGIHHALSQQGRIIIFMNRKGFSRTLRCKSCGYSPHCETCGTPLTMYKNPAHLLCAACRQTQDIPTVCPSCLMPHLCQRGVGIEQIEELVRAQFPDARVQRMDRDATPSPSQTRIICQQFNGGGIDILIGTQLLLQEWSLAPAHTVCIPYADAGLHIPDFRSAEQVFHQLSDVIALAMPKEQGGQVILQTFLPTHHVMQALTLQDPAIFYDHECACRQVLLYPPFSHLILLIVSGKNEEQLRRQAESWAKIIQQEMVRQIAHSRDRSIHDHQLLLGPIPATVRSRKKTKEFKILIKAVEFKKTLRIISESRAMLEKDPHGKDVRFSVKVDPIEIL